jgi:hypothetical protein
MQWLDAAQCPEHFKDSANPNEQHFIVHSDMQGSLLADATQFIPGENCQYFHLQKTFDTDSVVNYQLIFSPAISGSIGLVGQSAPDSAWIDYAVVGKTVTISNWPKSKPIEFSAYYLDNQNNKQWMDATTCPAYFNGSLIPENQNFRIYLD